MSDWIKQTAADLMASRNGRPKVELCRDRTLAFTEDLVKIVIPERDSACPKSESDIEARLSEAQKQFAVLLECVANHELTPASFDAVSQQFWRAIPEIANMIQTDAGFISGEDPAAESVAEVFLCYPGLYAIAVYRIANQLTKLGVPVLPRVMTELAHSRTGIDIHPGATIGVPFFIDHGTGIVIGETTQIGDRVKIFQGVTLGALSVEASLRDSKRHPTIEDDVLIYANTAILGGDTKVGKGSVIGGNVWLTKSVAPRSKIFHQASQRITEQE